MQPNTNPSGGAQPSDLLPTIYKVEVRNEEKISAADRAFCERQQAAFYEALERVEQCHVFLTDQVEHLHDGYEIISHKPNGYIETCELQGSEDYIPFSYRIAVRELFFGVEALAELNHKINEVFAARIIRYFNETYHISVSIPSIDADTLKMGKRPVYTTYVDRVIEYLDGRSFRTTAEEEIIRCFLKVVNPDRWVVSKPELRGRKILFPSIVSYDGFYLKWHHCHRMAYGTASRLDTFCKGIMLGAEERLDGSRKSIAELDTDDVDLTRWYDTATESGVQFQFFKNGRIDVKFKDAAAAEACFRRLRLHELRLHNDDD